MVTIVKQISNKGRSKSLTLISKMETTHRYTPKTQISVVLTTNVHSLLSNNNNNKKERKEKKKRLKTQKPLQ